MKKEYLELIKESYDEMLSESSYEKNEIITEEIDKEKTFGLKFSGIDHKDYPTYTDAYIISGNYKDADGKTRALTQDEIAEISKDEDFVYNELMDFLH